MNETSIRELQGKLGMSDREMIDVLVGQLSHLHKEHFRILRNYHRAIARLSHHEEIDWSAEQQGAGVEDPE